MIYRSQREPARELVDTWLLFQVHARVFGAVMHAIEANLGFFLRGREIGQAEWVTLT